MIAKFRLKKKNKREKQKVRRVKEIFIEFSRRLMLLKGIKG